jgi:hypothetical protein
MHIESESKAVLRITYKISSTGHIPGANVIIEGNFNSEEFIEACDLANIPGCNIFTVEKV